MTFCTSTLTRGTSGQTRSKDDGQADVLGSAKLHTCDAFKSALQANDTVRLSRCRPVRLGRLGLSCRRPRQVIASGCCGSQQQQDTQLPRPQAQVCETEAAAAEGTDVTEVAAAAQDAAAEIARLRAQNQQLREQAHHDRVISQGLLDAQPGLAAVTRRKQMAAATDKTEVPVWAGESSRGNWKQKVQMGSKLHSGNTAKENTDSNKTGMALRWVGVRSDVHRRQQAQLAVYRKNCQQAKIWTFDPTSTKRKATATATTEKKKTTAATSTEKEEATAVEDTDVTEVAAAAQIAPAAVADSEKEEATAATVEARSKEEEEAADAATRCCFQLAAAVEARPFPVSRGDIREANEAVYHHILNFGGYLRFKHSLVKL